MKLYAVIMARKGSKRIKNKMYKKINGKSLIEIKISQLLKVKKINKIIIGSDDIKVEKICDRFKNKKVQFIKRERKFCIESCEINDAIRNLLSKFQCDWVIWSHLTNPYTNEKHYKSAIKNFFNSKKKYDSLFSTNICLDYFWDQKEKPINHNPNERFHSILSSGKIKPIYSDNGAIFIRKYSEMIQDGRFWGRKPMMYKMSQKHGWDINKQWDLDSSKLKSFWK